MSKSSTINFAVASGKGNKFFTQKLHVQTPKIVFGLLFLYSTGIGGVGGRGGLTRRFLLGCHKKIEF
jgi:hypothetical protein